MSAPGDLLDGRPPRIAQSEDAGHFVKGLAGRVVRRGSQEGGPRRLLDQVETGVASGNDEGNQWWLQPGMGEKTGIDVGQEVVHGHQGPVPEEGQSLGETHPYQE